MDKRMPSQIDLQPPVTPAPPGFRVVALMIAYNEADIIVPSISGLIEQGIEVYLIDNWSTDGTYDLALKLVGHGLIAIERFPLDGPDSVFRSKLAFRRKEQLASEIKADWFIHHDADEVRTSPWYGVSLKDGIWAADSAGFNAIDHTVIVFPPIDNGFKPGSDFEKYFRHFEFGTRAGHFLQVKAWKNLGLPVSLAESAGHEVSFPGRKIYPRKFLLKHYPIRSQSHGEKKTFLERKPRRSPDGMAQGWHTHYDLFDEGHNFLHDPSDLLTFDEQVFYDRYLSGHGSVMPARAEEVKVTRNPSAGGNQFGTAVKLKKCDKPNQHARPASLLIDPGSATFHGYQEFVLTRKALNVLPTDEALRRKRKLLAPYFQPKYLGQRTLLDIGANNGFFSFWAIQKGATQATALDLDADYVNAVEQASTTLGFENIEAVKGNFSDWTQPADVVLALALVHWIYSCTDVSESLDQAIEKLASLTRYMLIVEWVAPDDPAIEFFHHLDWNNELAKEPYCLEKFEAALARHFITYEMIGEISSTRRLYVAFRANSGIDLSGPLPFIRDKKSVIYSRWLTSHDGIDYWSRIYDCGDVVVKQATLDLAAREGSFLNRLHSDYFPRVSATSSHEGYSVIELEKIEGPTLSESITAVNATVVDLYTFIQHCLNLLEELERKGILHRDISVENIILRQGKPVLIDFGWAISDSEPYFTPTGLASKTRPPDGSFSDIYSMGKVFAEVNANRYLQFDLVIGQMTQTDATLRITDLNTLRVLFADALKFADHDPSSRARIAKVAALDLAAYHPAVTHLLQQLTKRTQRLALLREEKEKLSKQISEREGLFESPNKDLQDQNEVKSAHNHALESLYADRKRLEAQILRYEKETAWLFASNESLKSLLSDRDGVIRDHEATLRDYEEGERELKEEISQLQKEQEHLQRTNELLSAQISSITGELEKITGSIGWKALSRYGRFKYRHLLPIYRLLRLPPYKRTSTSDNGVSISIEEHVTPPVPETRELPLDSNAFDIICFPIIDWDFRFQRPQQLMSRFADAGHRVFYVSGGSHSGGSAYTIQQKRNNVYEVSLRGLQHVVYADNIDEQGCDVLLASLDELRKDLLLGATVTFAQLPFWWPLASKARDHFAWPIVYDCMDHHAGFSTNKKVMVDLEEHLLAGADLVVASSAFLQQQATQRNSNVLLIPNACDYEHFSKATQTKNERTTIGYYGAIADWFDSDLVADLAERRPDWDFLLVGSTFSADVRRLSRLPNVSLVGEKHYAEIPDWLGRFDVAIIPFKRTDLTEATNPVKAYEILASGKPLVSVPIPEVAALVPLVRLASTAIEFENQISEALTEDQPELVENRRLFAAANTWQKRYESLAPAVRETHAKASIIVVTYNNLNLNRLCLESIYARTEWPNFEVIVVDNNSTDGTADYLKEVEGKFPNLHVVLNDSNLGFAAANNIGLRKSSGDYLVLLNNDTVVTRGWLSTLIRHLHNDPEIGLIGPVTNMIGNEAKVDVGYVDIKDMPAWAANYVQEHDGEFIPVLMLAMFCVAMRKEVFEKVGFLDEQFGIGMFEDDDYTHRIKVNGFRVACAADSFVHHFSQASFKKLIENGKYQGLFDENRLLFERKWNMQWTPHQYAPPKAIPVAKPVVVNKTVEPKAATVQVKNAPKKEYPAFYGRLFHTGRCNICGRDTQFFYDEKSLYRESLTCGECLTTSRYRSIARGVLQAIRELTGIEANSLAELDRNASSATLKIYETQQSFYYGNCAYPIPDLLAKRKWIEVQTSTYRPQSRFGSRLGKNFTNQNLEQLTFADNTFNIVITSDVMEHVRLDKLAHQEIRRVLKPGGVYIFTVPHFRDRKESLERVAVVDPAKPSEDQFLMEPEYHGDSNSASGKALSYRAYGTELDEYLRSLGFEVDYCKKDFPEIGVMNTELFYCRLSK